MSPLWCRVSLLLLLCLFAPISGNWLQRIEGDVSWVTEIVKPLPNISIDKIMGKWYMIEEVSESQMTPTNACIWYVFVRDSSGNMTVQWHQDDGLNRFPVVPPMAFQDGGLWALPVVYTGFAIVDLSPDGRYLTVAICVQYAMSCTAAVFARNMADGGRQHLNELTEIHHRLTEAGLNSTNRGYLKNMYVCDKAHPEPVSSEEIHGPVRYEV